MINIPNPTRFAIMRDTGERKKFSELKKGDIFKIYDKDGTELTPRIRIGDYWIATSDPWITITKAGSISINCRWTTL
jgi:hypothetical protein